MKKTLVLTLLLIYGLLSFGQNKVVSQKEVYDKLLQAGVHKPLIVLKQGIHESANFKNKRAVQQNNYFGLLKNGRLRYFDSIESCIEFYKRVIQWNYQGGDYYQFLKRKKYATDPRYKKKVMNTPIDFIIE